MLILFRLIIPLIISVGTVTAASPLMAAPKKPKITVTAFEAKSGVPKPLAALVSNALSTELFDLGKFDLVDPDIVSHILNQEELRQLGVIDGSKSLLGQMEGLDYVVVGSVGRINGRYLLSARLVQVPSTKATVVVSEISAASIDEVLSTIQIIAAKLAGKKAKRKKLRSRVAVMAFLTSEKSSQQSTELMSMPLSTRVQPNLGEVTAAAIIAGLSQAQDLNVLSSHYLAVRLSRNNIGYGGSSDTLVASRLAKQVGADLMIAGSIQLRNNEYSILSNLIDVNTGRTLRSAKSKVKAKGDIIGTGAAPHVREYLEHLSAINAPKRINGITTTSLPAYRSYLLGYDAMMAGEYRESELWLKRATKDDPNFGSAYSALACVASLSQKEKEARKYLHKAKTFYEEMSAKEQLWNDADEAWIEGDNDTIKLFYLHHTRLYPDDARGWYYLGIAEHWKFNDPAAAIVSYDRALIAQPDSYPVLKSKVDALEALKKPKAAQEVLRAYLLKYPKAYHTAAAKGRMAQIKF